VHHPVLLIATVLVTLVGQIGTATMFTSLFVASRSVLLFQNALTYPIYILGGVLVSVSYLPDWLRPVSNIVFLSWSADLLRDCLDQAGPVPAWPWRMLATAGLGLLALGVGVVVVRRVNERVRRTGLAGMA
jgi:ABC-2 type transport system permease protein